MALLSLGRKDAAPRATGWAIRRNRGEKAACRSDLGTMVKGWYSPESSDHMFG
jgi:hypothetical protein